MRHFAVAFIALGLTFGSVSTLAQDATPTSGACIEPFALDGTSFDGKGSTVVGPVALDKGLLLIKASLSDAGALWLMDPDGNKELLSNKVEAIDSTFAAKIPDAGDYYVVVEFYTYEGTWALALNQPAS